MRNIDADEVFFENPELGRVCLGGGPFEYVLLCSRTGGFEVWSSLEKGAKCLAGDRFKGPSEISIGGLTVFRITPEEWQAIVDRGSAA